MARKQKTTKRPQEHWVQQVDENGDPIIPGVTNIEQGDSVEPPGLDSATPVRMRPGMYIGDVGVRGLHHLFREIIDNSVYEVLAGHCTEIDVILGGDYSLTVSDNGRSVPIDRKGMYKSRVELAFTQIGHYPPSDRIGRERFGTLHGAGSAVVNALCDWLRCKVKHAGKVWQVRFERGVLATPLAVVGECGTEEEGTAVSWLADKTIFKTALTESGGLAYDGDLIRGRCRELAYQLPRVRITFHDQLHGKPPETFHFPNGVADYVRELNQGREVFPAEPILLHGSVGTSRVQIALQYNESGQELIVSFANTRLTWENGRHVKGFLRGLKQVRQELAEGKPKEGGKSYRRGLTAVVSVFTDRPMYNNSDTAQLMTPEMEVLTYTTTYVGLQDYFGYLWGSGDTLRKQLNAFVPI